MCENREMSAQSKVKCMQCCFCEFMVRRRKMWGSKIKKKLHLCTFDLRLRSRRICASQISLWNKQAIRSKSAFQSHSWEDTNIFTQEINLLSDPRVVRWKGPCWAAMGLWWWYHRFSAPPVILCWVSSETLSGLRWAETQREKVTER